MQELGLSPHLMQAIRNLYRRRQLLRPVRQLRATAAGCLAGSEWDAKMRSFEDIASVPICSHYSQSRSSREYGDAVRGSDAAATPSQLSHRQRLKARSRPWSARSARSTRATSVSSLASLTKASTQEELHGDEGELERRCVECTADSRCLRCVATKPLLAGERRSDAFLRSRRPLVRRRSPEASGRPERRPAPQEDYEAFREQEARAIKQARLRDWLQRKELELAERRRQQQAEEDLLREEQDYRDQRRFEQEVELQRQRVGRLRRAELQQQELDMALENQIFRSSAREMREAVVAVGAQTLAAYSTPRVCPGRTRCKSARTSRCR